MGRGCAREAANYFSNFPRLLGNHIKTNGNVSGLFLFEYNYPDEKDVFIFTIPVKHAWWEKADPKLIEESIIEFKSLVDEYTEEYGFKFDKIALPRPGCGNGQLDWEDVKPILEKYLDDRFIIYDY